MKTSFLKFSNFFIFLILSALGFWSCEKKLEYGVRSTNYLIKGKVLSKETGLPIKGIKVSTPNEFRYEVTNNDGFYRIEDGNISPDTFKFELNFRDIDGEQNGSYKDKDTVVFFVYPSHWKEIDINLDPK